MSKPEPTVTMLTNLKVAPGHEQEWREIWRRARAIHQKRAGLRGARFHRGRDNPRRFIILSQWQERGDYEAFIRARALPD